MTDKKILIFFDSKSQLDIDNFEFLIKNLDLNKYKIDLMIEESIKIKVSKKINIIRFKSPTNFFQNYIIKLKLKQKNKYDSSIIYTTESLLGNYWVRKASKNTTIIVDLKDKIFDNIDNYRKYFIDRNIYEFNHIIFKNYQDQEKFIKFYPSLSKKTSVINDLINYVEIEKLSKETIPEKIKKTDINLLLIEELNEEKNKILDKLKLIKDLKADIPNIKLYIIGDGIDKLAYESYIEDNHLEDNIILLGHKKNIYPYIKKCKYMLLLNKKILNRYLNETLVLKTTILFQSEFIEEAINDKNKFNLYIKKNQKKELLNIFNSNLNMKKTNFEKTNFQKIKDLEKIIENKF